ncbi:MAG TPA: NAD(P)-dependent glycerol-3-phosphate dehydrogenase [Deltaproteobacteria bacterium]|jgi:glycerol-3-phosphate dehydrogenase (NAD(P)+)|nr:glycerol-3-phosphate acyltransferase [Deltaproteobacteria bacterium]HIL87793.1 NAD(P)-dependent glycerol-3-phosphate dehydrogenase [Deltaproteobacteria bacterium]
MTEHNPNAIGIFGAGAWGTALALHLARQGRSVHLWAREAKVREAIRHDHINSVFLPGVRLPAKIEVVDAAEQVLERAKTLLVVVPSHAMPWLIQTLAEGITVAHDVVLATKGFGSNETLLLSDSCAEGWPVLNGVQVLSGPTFAADVAAGHPVAAVLAGTDSACLRRLQSQLASSRFRLYPSTDLVGVQVGGAMKNVIAIASGIADGMDLGLSGRAALISRGLSEMMRLGVALGGRPETLSGVAGLGDLVLTATGNLSRNYSLGVALGSGESLAEYLQGRHTVIEGMENAGAVRKIAKRYGLDLPICTVVDSVIQGKLNCTEALDQLLSRPDPGSEFADLFPS